MRRLASDCCKPPHHRSRHSLSRSIRSSSPRLHAPATQAAIENNADPIAATHGRPVQYSQKHAYRQEAPTPPTHSFLAEGPRASRALSASRAFPPPEQYGAAARLGPHPVADGHLVDVAALAAPPCEFAAYGLHAGGLQVLVHARVPHRRYDGMRGGQVVVAGEHLAVAAVGVDRLHRNGRRMALPRSRDRRVPQEGRGLVDVRAHNREAGRGCARAGGRKGESARGLQPRLPRRPGFPARFPGAPALPRVPWDRPIHVAAGQPMGQRARGILLQDAQARAGKRQGPQDEGGGEAGRVQMHRALLQQAKDALIGRP